MLINRFLAARTVPVMNRIQSLNRDGWKAKLVCRNVQDVKHPVDFGLHPVVPPPDPVYKNSTIVFPVTSTDRHHGLGKAIQDQRGHYRCVQAGACCLCAVEAAFKYRFEQRP